MAMNSVTQREGLKYKFIGKQNLSWLICGFEVLEQGGVHSAAALSAPEHFQCVPNKVTRERNLSLNVKNSIKQWAKKKKNKQILEE